MPTRGATIFVGYGTELPPNTAIDTPWGVLRSRRPEDADVLRDAGAEYDPGRGSILEERVDDALITGPDGTKSLHGRGIEDPNWKRLALGLLLAQEPVAAGPTLPWCCLNRFDGGGASATFGQFRKGKAVTQEELPELERWVSRVSDTRLSDVAVDRATAMVSRITDDVDALIDGVIVWECLFGTGNTQELTYRISINMACALTDVPDERLEYQREIKDLYNARSRIIHGRGGSLRLRSSEDRQNRDRVQELTLKAMRELLGRHPALIGAKAEDYVAFVLGTGLHSTGSPGR